MKFPIGAIDENGEYSSPTLASKKHKYKCPDCKAPVCVKQGQIKIHHFAHISTDKCSYFDKPSESQIHKDSKLLIKQLLQTVELQIERECFMCNASLMNCTIPIQTNVQIEYRFEYNGLKIADVASLDNGLTIFEIYHSHRTSEENRPETWFEINVQDLIEIKDNKLSCMRRINCDKCIEKAEQQRIEWNKKVEQNKIDEQIRIEYIEQQSIECAKQKEIEWNKKVEQNKINEQRSIEWTKQQEIAWNKKVEQRRIDEQYNINKQQENIIKKERESIIKKEREALEDLIFEEYTTEIVNKYKFNEADSSKHTIWYKEFEFLHPYHVHRFRKLRESKINAKLSNLVK